MMTRILFVLGAVLLGLMPASAQTTRTVNVLTVYASYLDTRSGTPVRTPHWTDPATNGAGLIAGARNLMASGEGTYGVSVAVTGTAYAAWVDSSQTMGSTCNTGTIYGDVVKAVGIKTTSIFGTVSYGLPAGVTLAIQLPPNTPCNSEAALGGNVFYTVAGGYFNHELGHILGLVHPYEQHCTPQWSTCATGQDVQYSLMGLHGDGLILFEKDRLGAFAGSTYQIARLAASGDVTVQLSNTMTPGLKGAVLTSTITVPKTQTFLGFTWTTTVTETHTVWAEYRQAQWPGKGVILWGTPKQALIDLDPSNADRFTMNIGETWCDGAYVCVTLTAKDDTTATLHFTKN